ncbi:hypothetical protein Dimus_000483 [Dionaea muscipula]
MAKRGRPKRVQTSKPSPVKGVQRDGTILPSTVLPTEAIDDSALVDASVTLAEEQLMLGEVCGEARDPGKVLDDDLIRAPYLRAAHSGLGGGDVCPNPLAVRFKGPEGEVVEQAVKFEWLPIRCSRCGKWGHKPLMCSANRTVKDPPLAWKRKPDVVKPAGVSFDGRKMVKEGMSHDPVAGKPSVVNELGAGEWQVVVGKRHGIRGGGSLSPNGKRLPVALVKGLDISSRIPIHVGAGTCDGMLHPDLVAHDHRSMECSGSK